MWQLFTKRVCCTTKVPLPRSWKTHRRLNCTPTQTLSQAHWQSKPVESLLSSTPIRGCEKGQSLHSFDLTFVSFAQPRWYRSSISHRKWKQLEAAAMPHAALMPSPVHSYVSSDFCLWPLDIVPALVCSDCSLTDTRIAFLSCQFYYSAFVPTHHF